MNIMMVNFQVFPEKVMVPTTAMQVEFYHYPKQQDKATDIFEYMQDNGKVLIKLMICKK